MPGSPFSLTLAFLFISAVVASGQTNAGPATGLNGTISISPAQPGPTKIDRPDAKPLANMTFLVENRAGVLASFTTDDQGQFKVSLPPGHYVISRKGDKPAIGHFGPFEVDVVAGKMTTVTWECDSGLR